MSDLSIEILERDIRKAIFTPAKNKEDLHAWIKFFLNTDLPNCTVLEESTSNPMETIYEVYSAALTNDPNLSRILAYACRSGFKTMLAAQLEALSICHLDRSVAHMAALEGQAVKAQGYVKDYFALPYLRDYVTTRNERRMEFEHYFNKETGEHLIKAQYDKLSDEDKFSYEMKKNYIQIIICTLRGANGDHVPFFVIDECDIIQDVKAYREALFIPSRFGEKTPITLLVSTRKTGIGLVQEEIDTALEKERNPKAGGVPMRIRHWTAIDITEACPPERHRPDEPKVNLYYSDDNLDHFSEEEFLLRDAEIQKGYVKKEAFKGCATCPIFSSCKTRLATHQKSTSPMLKTITQTIQEFSEHDLEFAQAQLMSRKPPSTGMVYPRFSREVHMLTAQQMGAKITGEKNIPENFTKVDLIALMKEKGLDFYAGLDWGFTHDFVIASGAKQGLNIFVFDIIAAAGLDPEQKLTVAEKIKLWNPTIFPDPEAPDQISLFLKKGYNCRRWSKKGGSVKMGIDIMRMKMRPAAGEPSFFLLKDDPQCELAATRLLKYAFKFDASGNPTDVPNETGDDIPDALRYMIMNIFTPRGTVTATEDTPSTLEDANVVNLPTSENYLQYFINQHLGTSSLNTQNNDDTPTKGRKGRIIWNLD